MQNQDGKRTSFFMLYAQSAMIKEIHQACKSFLLLDSKLSIRKCHQINHQPQAMAFHHIFIATMKLGLNSDMLASETWAVFAI